MDKGRIYQQRDQRCQVAEILNPTLGYRGELTKKGLTPKNHEK